MKTGPIYDFILDNGNATKDEALAALEAVDDAINQHWTPVAIDLPPSYQRVLVSAKEKAAPTTNRQFWLAYLADDGWRDGWGKWQDQWEITHWMHLPAHPA